MTPRCVIVDPLASNSMKSQNPYSGFHRSEYAPTLDTSSQSPTRNAGGLLIYAVELEKSGSEAK